MTDVARFPRTILPTVCIPWTDEGAFDGELFAAVVRARLAGGIRHLYVFGTAGEGYAVTDAQFDAIVACFAEACAETPDAHPMVGLIGQSMGTTLGRIERAMARGIRDFQVTLPAWGVLTDDEVRTFLRGVLPRFPEARFLHYNLLRAGRLISGRFYAELAAEHPNLVGTKNGTGDTLRLHALLTEAPMLRHFLTEVGYPFGCSVGAPGLLQSLSSTNDAQAWRFFRAGVAGDAATLAAMHPAYLAVEEALTAFGGDAVHIDGAYEKMLQKVTEERLPLRLLPPYTAATDDAYRGFRAWLAAHHPELLPGAPA